MVKEIEKAGFDPGFIDSISKGHQVAQVLFTATKCGMFELLHEEKQAEEVAKEIKGEPKITEKILNALACLGLVSKKDGKYINADTARCCLRKDSPFYQGNLLGLVEKSYAVYGNLDKILKGEALPRFTDKGQEAGFDESFIHAMAEGAMRGSLQNTIKAVSELPEFKKAGSILDLGGGHGLYAIAFARENPNIKSIVFDLAPVSKVTQDYIERYGMKGRIDVAAGDFMKDELPGKYDIIFASDVLYQPGNSIHVPLQKISRSLNDGGSLIMKHWVLNEDRTGPLTVVLWEMWLSILGAPHCAYTTKEYTGLLKDHALKDIQTIDISAPHDPSLMVIAKKGG